MDTVTANSSVAAPAVDELIEVRLTAVRYAARDTNLFEFRRPDGKPLPPYEPGAHVDMHLPNGLVRNYSLIVAKPDPSTYTFGIKRDPASRGGSSLHPRRAARRQDPQAEPAAQWLPPRRGGRQTVLIAGGIGITAIWCMIQRLEELGRNGGSSTMPAARADITFLEAIEKLAPIHLHFDDERDGRFVDIGVLMNELPKAAHLYCCGPAPMMDAFEAATKDWPRAQIHVEYFTPRPVEAKRGGFTVELARSAQEYFIPEGETILNVLLDAGVDIDYSCELGICGACEQRVISGIPEHRDSILSEEEQAENTRVMICCAGCKTDRLVLVVSS